MINGQVNPAISVPLGQPIWLRLVNAGVQFYLQMHMAQQYELSGSFPCEVCLVAKDGIYIKEPMCNEAFWSQGFDFFAPGNRLDTVWRCSTAGAFEVYVG